MSLEEAVLRGLKRRKEREEQEAKEKARQQVNTGGLNIFQKSQGNAGETVLGTLGDVGLSVLKGAGGVVEGFADALQYGAAGIAAATGNHKEAESLRRIAQFDESNNSWLAEALDQISKKSVIGDTSRAVLEGVGQVGLLAATGGAAGAAGLGAGATTAITSGMMGLSSVGHGMTEAYQGGATDKEAAIYGLASGAVDTVTEALFGGLGKASKAVGFSKGALGLDDKLAQALTGRIKSKLVKNLIQAGVKATGEGLEEALAYAGQTAAKKLTYMSEKELGELWNNQELLENFVVGTMTGAIMQAGDVVKDTRAGRDLVTKYSDSEQTVLDKVYEARVAEQEKDGKKLSTKEKGRIYDEVVRDMDRGYIAVEDIEAALGGETYRQYQNTVKAQEAAQKEFDQLNAMKNGDMTGMQTDRREQLRQQIAQYRQEDTAGKLQRQYRQEVEKLASTGKLAESYRERGRKGEYFKADISQYDEKQRATVQRAIDSGILNNTNKTHEFVDMLAKIEAEKGVAFSFTDNEKLKQTGFVVPGVMVNGYVDQNGVTLNINSVKALNSVAGHEITHVLEGTQLYDSLREAVFAYAESKGELQKRRSDLEKLYANVKGADIDGELTADLVGDYIFTDEDFVRSLHAGNRNLFQKIWGEIKYLLKIAAAGSKEARQLEKAKKLFEDVYREASAEKSTTRESGVRYSVSQASKSALSQTDVQRIQQIGRKSINSFTRDDIRLTESFAKQYWEEMGVKSPFYRSWFGDWRVNDKTPVQVADRQGNTRGVQKNEDTGWDIQISGKVFSESQHLAKKNTAAIPYLSYVNDIVRKAILLDSFGFGSEKVKSQNSLLMHSMYAVADIGNGPEVLKLYVEEMNDPNRVNTAKRAYQLQNIEKAFAVNGGVQGKSPSSLANTTNATYSVADLFADVKTRDSNFTPKPASQIVNSDGTPKVMYHGSPAQFTAFDKKKAKSSGLYGRGFYFTDSKAQAGAYGNLYSVYLDVKHPLQNGGEQVSRKQVQKYIEAVAENEDYSIENYGTYDVDRILDIVMGKAKNADAFRVIQDINATAIGDMADAAELFNSVNGTAFDGIIVPTETVVFRPEQIKSVTDNIGTFDRSNPDIRYSLTVEGDVAPVRGGVYGKDIGIDRQARELWEYMERTRKKTAGEPDMAEEASLQSEDERTKSADSKPIYTLRELMEEQYSSLELELRESEESHRVAEERFNERIEAMEASYERKSEKVENYIQRLHDKARNLRREIEENQKAKEENAAEHDRIIAEKTHQLKGKKHQESKASQNLKRAIARQERLKEDNRASYDKRIRDLESRLKQVEEDITNTPKNESQESYLRKVSALQAQKKAEQARYEKRAERIREKMYNTRARIRDITAGEDRFVRKQQQMERQLEADKKALREEIDALIDKQLQKTADKDRYVAEKARELYDEIKKRHQGQRPSKILGEMLDRGHSWNAIKSALLMVEEKPGAAANPYFQAEQAVRKILNEAYNDAVYEVVELETEYGNRAENLEKQAKESLEKYKVAYRRRETQMKYAIEVAKLVGNISGWVDKKLGILYQTNTLRRNLRDIVKDENGNPDIAKADAIYDYLQGTYNENHAALNREANKIKEKYRELNITKEESVYVQMLGEYRSPDNTSGSGAKIYVTKQEVDDYLAAHKDTIDEAKVEKILKMARKDFDDLFERLNVIYRAHGMRELGYIQGYFPHLQEIKPNFWQRLLNWKPAVTEAHQKEKLPTDQAGLTEHYRPDKKSQSFNKERKGPVTDFDFMKGFDMYVAGALDHIYHIPDIQRRKAFENHIRMVAGENVEALERKVDAIHNSDVYDAEEAQEQIDLALEHVPNNLSNFVQDLRTGTNVLAGKKSSMDRGVEQATNRAFYSVMSNVSNRVSANMVAGSISSALTNFIPITQAQMQVGVKSTAQAMVKAIRSYVKDDGAVDKSVFLTNRLRQNEDLYRGGWDKFSDKVGIMFGAIDDFVSQTVWRSKYIENREKGMSETEAVKNADQFAENVMAGRSPGNMPTIFESKNPIIKMVTAFQLEAANQYGYFFKDVPIDMKEEGKKRIAWGALKVMIGAAAFNALIKFVTGREPATDPIGILADIVMDAKGEIEDDDEEKPGQEIASVTVNAIRELAEELPFIGGLLGGGRVPISSALPYDGVMEAITGTVTDFGEGDWANLTKEWLNPVIYGVSPMAGGQAKKTVEGLAMFLNGKDVKGSYTTSGSLRYEVEPTLWNVIQATLFGQYASSTAQDYFDQGRKPLSKGQLEEFQNVDMTMQEYWDFRDALNSVSKQNEKMDIVAGLDLPLAQKNYLANNLADRKDPIDLTGYNMFDDFEEFDFYNSNPEKYRFLKSQGITVKQFKSFDEDTKDAWNWAADEQKLYLVSKAITPDLTQYWEYSKAIGKIESDKDEDGNAINGSKKKKIIAYIQSLDISDEAKMVLLKKNYTSDDSYNREIITYINDLENMSYSEKKTILEKLGFKVGSDGRITW